MNESGSCCNETSPCTNGTVVPDDKVYSTHDYIGNVSVEQQKQCDAVRAMCNDLQTLIMSLPCCGTRSFSDRCVNIARTNLEQVCMYTIKAIVFQGKTVS